MLQGMASLDNSSSRILGTGAVPEDGIVEGVATSLQGGGSWASQAEPPQSIVASTGSPINPECSQKTSLYARICSRSIMRKANKPSGLDEMTLNIRAEGTADFELAVAISSALQRAGSSAPAVALDVQKADQMASLFGQQLSGRVWFGQPQVGLSYQKQTSQFEELIGFSQRGCSDSGVPQDLCPADGDTLTTWVRFTSASDASVWSEVAVTTDVQALPSCDLSVVNTTIAGRSRVSPTEPMSLSVAVMDVDGLPIRFTRADVRFTFDNRCKANPDSVNAYAVSVHTRTYPLGYRNSRCDTKGAFIGACLWYRDSRPTGSGLCRRVAGPCLSSGVAAPTFTRRRSPKGPRACI